MTSVTALNADGVERDLRFGELAFPMLGMFVAGIPSIAVTLSPMARRGFGADIQRERYLVVLPEGPDLAENLARFEPYAVIPGSDSGIMLAEQLSQELTPRFSNATEKNLCRLHKAHMQSALEEAGLPVLKTFHSNDEDAISEWILTQGMQNRALILKPPMSAGSDNVHRVSAGGDWRVPFRRILSESAKVSGLPNDAVVVQEEAVGVEFALGTVSAGGSHHLSHIIRYNKMCVDGRNTVYDFVEFVPYTIEAFGVLMDFVRRALDALGVSWGAAHTEVMLTADGPRLIESSPRMCGGPVVEFSRLASGNSQADRLAELFDTGEIVSRDYDFKRTVVPVFLKSDRAGLLTNSEILDAARSLPTHFKTYLWYRNGDRVPKTVDYLTSLGIVALTSLRNSRNTTRSRSTWSFPDSMRERSMTSILTQGGTSTISVVLHLTNIQPIVESRNPAS